MKVVIDAYNGTMSFFVFDSTDPVLKTYEKAFPKLFTDRSQANQLFPGIINHLRYPEDLFRAQTNMFGRYHITDAKNFYSKSDAWEISQDPGSGELSTQGVPTQTINPQTGQPQAVRQQRMDPTYLLMRLPGDPTESFLILQPFVPFSTDDKQQNLAAFLTASSDPDDYGTMQAFVTPPGQFIDGPAIVNSRIKQTPAISQQLSLLNVQGSKVVLGNVLVIPIEQSLLYVQPLYVKADQNPLPQLKKVILVSGNQAVMFDTFKDALSSVTGGPPPSTLEQQPNGPSNGGTSPPTTAPPNAGQTQTVSALLDQAQADFVAADAALRAGDLAGFQQKYKDGVTAVQQADAVGKAAAGGSGGSGSGAGGGGGAPASTTTTTAAGGSA